MHCHNLSGSDGIRNLVTNSWNYKDDFHDDGSADEAAHVEGRRGEDVVEGGYQAVALQGRWQQEDV